MDARRDKSPGDLVSQGIGGAMVFADPLFEKSKRGISNADFFEASFGHRPVGFLDAGLGHLRRCRAKTEFKVAWSIYVGWMPWGYAADRGIVGEMGR